MKRGMAIAAVLATVGLAGCDDRSGATEAPEGRTQGQAAAPKAASPAAAGVTAPPAVEGAPAFAVLYPDASPTGAPTLAEGPSGPGGLTTFVTKASPEEVVAFYRERAEAEGLASVMAMNQGDAQAYGAASSQVAGASLQVVASPTPEGGANVQLSWSAGRDSGPDSDQDPGQDPGR